MFLYCLDKKYTAASNFNFRKIQLHIKEIAKKIVTHQTLPVMYYSVHISLLHASRSKKFLGDKFIY